MHILLKKNKFKNEDANIEGLELYVVQNYKEQEKMFLNNQIDVTCDTLFNEEQCDVSHDEISVQLPLKYYMFINEKYSKYFNFDIRQAIYHRIKKYNFGIRYVANSVSFIPECFHYHDSLYDCCPSKLDALTDAGKIDFSILYSNYYPSKLIAKIIANILIGMGFSINITEMNHRDIYEKIISGEYDIAIPIISALYYSPAAFLTLFIDDEQLGDKMGLYNKLIEDYYFTVIMPPLVKTIF
mgnify:CR=1 FL=1